MIMICEKEIIIWWFGNFLSLYSEQFVSPLKGRAVETQLLDKNTSVFYFITSTLNKRLLNHYFLTKLYVFLYFTVWFLFDLYGSQDPKYPRWEICKIREKMNLTASWRILILKILLSTSILSKTFAWGLMRLLKA